MALKSSINEGIERHNEVLVVAGEASADLHAATLIQELRKQRPELHFFGIGGHHLKEAGMEIVLPAENLNVVGLADWLGHAPEILRSYWGFKRLLKSRRPQFAILLDLPDFNLRIAHFLKKLGVQVVYFIPPQVWAWRKGRIKQIQKLVDLLLVVFPFEKKFYQEHGVTAQFVGHPLLDRIEKRKAYRPFENVQRNPRIALLPGSRRSEVKYHLPILLELVPKILTRYPKAEFILPVAPTLQQETIQTQLKDLPIHLSGEAYPTLEWADFAIVASGTATLETALIGTPFVLYYKVHSMSAWIFRHLIRYQGFIGMPNVLHQRQVVGECFQENATAECLLTEMERVFASQTEYEKMVRDLVQCRALLGNQGASVQAAHKIAEWLS